MTAETRSSPYFPLRTSRLAIVRDVAMLAVCIALVTSFVVDVWRAAPPEPLRASAPVACGRAVG